MRIIARARARASRTNRSRRNVGASLDTDANRSIRSHARSVSVASIGGNRERERERESKRIKGGRSAGRSGTGRGANAELIIRTHRPHITRVALAFAICTISRRRGARARTSIYKILLGFSVSLSTGRIFYQTLTRAPRLGAAPGEQAGGP